MNKEEIFKVEIDYVFNTKLKENLKMRQKWKRFVMHVEK